jgi:hypothetical protein
MRIDRTWTISFEHHEQQHLLAEIENINFPADLGWKPILQQLATSFQCTLPLRAIERLALELDIVRTNVAGQLPRGEYQKRFPLITSINAEVESILYSSKRISA